jgi:hypothetical protein
MLQGATAAELIEMRAGGHHPLRARLRYGNQTGAAARRPGLNKHLNLLARKRARHMQLFARGRYRTSVTGAADRTDGNVILRRAVP